MAYQVEASLSRNRDMMMEDRYRRLHYEAGSPQYWPQPPPTGVILPRFKRHLPSIPKKKQNSKKLDHYEVPEYAPPYKDKYGSVSAHSTSAIYGALRAPQYHAVYGPSNIWYASVRSLNRNPRDMVYPPDAYEWREPLYEEAAKEVYVVPPQMEVVPRHPCACVVRRRPGHESLSHVKSSRLLPRCKQCANVFPSNGSTNSGLLSKKPSINSEKMKPPLVLDEELDEKPESASRMSGYKKSITGGSKFKRFFKGSTKDSTKNSRKSILEVDVTAYDLINKGVKALSVAEIDDSDVDDNLNDNAVAHTRWLKLQNMSKLPCSGSPRQIANKILASKFQKSQSENCIYSESHSVLVGGQRIFTDSHRPPEMNDVYGPELEVSSDKARWRKISVSEESICIPDPDYDYSDDSDESTLIGCKYRDPKRTYSPPPSRKSSSSSHNGLGYGYREISKSMSSLLNEDISSINVNSSAESSAKMKNVAMSRDCDSYTDPRYTETLNTYEECRFEPANPKYSLKPVQNGKQKFKRDSSSDTSSSGGTLSSEYQTWTSSSSNELKSILKKKRRRDHIQELGDASRVFHNPREARDGQKKKHVKFVPGRDEAYFDRISIHEDEAQPQKPAGYIYGKKVAVSGKDLSVINNRIYERVLEPLSDKNSLNGNGIVNDGFETAEGDLNPSDYTADPTADSTPEAPGNPCHSSTARPNNLLRETGLLPVSVPPSLPPARSSSLEDVRGKGNDAKGKGHRRRRRTTLPKRRFSDLHLHILLCPTKASLCGDASSSDDVPLTAASQRAHRSLPDSPSELDEASSFCFDFLDKVSKEKVPSSSRSIFYVSVDSNGQEKVPDPPESGNIYSKDDSKMEPQAPPVVLPSVGNKCNPTSEKDDPPGGCDPDGNLSPDTYDTDEDNLENDYENLDPIYEELSDVSNSSKRLTSLESNQKSFFEGASKIDILSYLEDAKERGISEGLSEDEKTIIEEEEEEEDPKVLSGEEEDLGEKNLVKVKNGFRRKEVLLRIDEDVEKEENADIEKVVVDESKSSRISEVERNDSGVGAETSKPARVKQMPSDGEEQLCADCDHVVEPVEDKVYGMLFSPLVCQKCEFRRCERKEIIIEFVDTELKYGRDLRIIKEEFCRPMEIAGLLAKEQLVSIFLNLEELVAANTKFSEKLQDALDIAMEHGDEDYTTVNLGKIFLESSSMLHAFETYCVKRASASGVLSSLEKEKELLRIFLRVSQVENTLLRRMNLPTFLMVPVQRVTRYPLLLSRLHKVTPIHHKDRGALKEAQQKIELHLEHINQQTSVGGRRILRKLSSISNSNRRVGRATGGIQLRKMSLEVLNWEQDETRFVIVGKLLYTQITDYPWNKKGKTLKFNPSHALLVALGRPNANYRPETAANDNVFMFPRDTGIRDASLVLWKDMGEKKLKAVREPMYLGNCVISCDPDYADVFEIQEYTTKDAFLLKGETQRETDEWRQQLRYHSIDLGPWRRRRNALANIMINGMMRP